MKFRSIKLSEKKVIVEKCVSMIIYIKFCIYIYFSRVVNGKDYEVRLINWV